MDIKQEILAEHEKKLLSFMSSYLVLDSVGRSNKSFQYKSAIGLREQLLKDMSAFLSDVIDRVRKERDEDFAIQQLTGMHTSEGRQVREVCLSMALTKEEWNKIKHECSFLYDYEKKEIEDYIKSLQSKEVTET